MWCRRGLHPGATQTDQAAVGAPSAGPARGAGVPQPAPSTSALTPNLELGALAMETAVRAEPNPTVTILGFLRAGIASSGEAPSQGDAAGCPEGWYQVEPRGYVRVGSTATIDPKHPCSRSRPPA